MDVHMGAGGAIHCRDAGEGPALVFSNSLGTDFRIWEPLIPHLPGGWRHLMYDKRGHGLSDCPPGPWSIVDHVADLAGLMEARGISGAVVCGLSVGGLIAQMLAATRPDLVRALVLCDTGAKIGTAEMWDARIAAIREGGLAAQSGPILERWFTSGFRADAARLAPWRNMLERTPLEGYLATAGAIRDCDHREATAGLRLPCLAVVGEADGATPPALVEETARLIPGARFEVIAGAGHIPCVEAPETLGRLMTGFLATL